MSRRINVFVPPISSFPELSLLDVYGLQDRIEVPKPPARGQRPEPSFVPQGGVATDDDQEDEEARFLYVIDSKGRLLEHLQYFGDDYRSALKTNFSPEIVDQLGTAKTDGLTIPIRIPCEIPIPLAGPSGNPVTNRNPFPFPFPLPQ